MASHIERIASSLMQSCLDLVSVYGNISDVIALYDDTEMNTFLATITNATDPVPGTPLTKQEVQQAQRVLKDFLDWMNNVAVVTSANRKKANQVASKRTT